MWQFWSNPRSLPIRTPLFVTHDCEKHELFIIEQARLLRQKTENRYLAVLVAAWGVNRCRKALFGVASRPDTPTAVLGGETVEH